MLYFPLADANHLQGSLAAEHALISYHIIIFSSLSGADGQPPADFCSAQGGCLNGGNCTNQCDGAVCDCPVPYTYGKRCEECE